MPDLIPPNEDSDMPRLNWVEARDKNHDANLIRDDSIPKNFNGLANNSILVSSIDIVNVKECPADSCPVGMSLRRQKHKQIPIWIRLKHLPMEYWTEDGLSIVASGVGTPLYADKITRNCSRLDFARICVMLDYSSTLLKHLVVISPHLRDGKEVPTRVDIEYEWLPQRCKQCCSLGHIATACPDIKKKDNNPPVSIFVRKQQVNHIENMAELEADNESEMDGSKSTGTVLKTHIHPLPLQNSSFDPLDKHNPTIPNPKGKDIVLYNPFDVLEAEIANPDVNTEADDNSLSTGPNICSPVLARRIWLAWDNLMISVEILRVENQMIHCRATNKITHTRCLISVLYGDYDIIPRRELWAALHTVSVISCEEPWIVLGDFNAIIDASEACGRAADTTASMNDFRNCIQETGLIHIPFTGCRFTWHNCSEGIRSLWKRLDRILVNAAWLDAWPNSSYICTLPSTSDHSPPILNVASGGNTHSLFRFDNFLAKQSGFLESVSNKWRHKVPGTAMYGVVCKLKNMKSMFRQQRKMKGNLADNVQLAKGFLDKAQELFSAYRDDFLLMLVKCCREVYSVAINLETSMLRQRAKLQWLRHGDQNSKLFFRKINARRARQRVFQITTTNGVVLTDMNEVTEEFVSFFKTLLGGTRSQRIINLSFLRQGIKHSLTQEEADLISAPVTQLEIKEALFDIDEHSAPSPDGYTSAFFKAAWPIVGEGFSAAVTEFFRKENY
ncbi:UNVERIFIED_CONTAM: hypothetical protein Scaly_3036500 [Sesamum calycinum]|uniref:Uncharacterized protein n=1 Tax=Sesamum calycinum TaxID=2727403 RepID=A0AAW2K655_9LAMI